MGKLIKNNHIKGTSVPPLYNVSKIRAMSDNEAEKRAKTILMHHRSHKTI